MVEPKRHEINNSKSVFIPVTYGNFPAHAVLGTVQFTKEEMQRSLKLNQDEGAEFNNSFKCDGVNLHMDYVCSVLNCVN